MNDPRFEVYPQVRAAATLDEAATEPTGEYGWRFRAANGRVSAIGGEGFTRREDAHRAIADLGSDLADIFWGGARPAIGELPIVDVED